MGPKKHRKRDGSSSSESDSSESSDNSRKKHSRHSRKHSSEESDAATSKQSKKDIHKTKRSASEEKASTTHDRYHRSSRSNSPDRKGHKERSTSREHTRRHHRRSRSNSSDRRGYRERSRSRDYTRRESDKERGRRDESKSTSDDKDNRKKDSRDHRYDHRDYRDDRRKDDFRNDNRDEWKNSRDRRDNRRRSRSRSFDHANAKWGRNTDSEAKDSKTEGQEKQKPNFALSGKLTEETNTYRGVVIKYSEPPEARKPRRRWRLYPFKGDKALQTLYIHRESAYLIGRDRKVVDLAVDHPSCSKQHAALQYRLVPFTRDNGSAGKRVRPYLIDLDSANGTYINNKRIDAKKYVELLEKDVVKFGYSSREYVLLHENSKDEAMDDDVKPEDEEIKEEIDIKIERS